MTDDTEWTANQLVAYGLITARTHAQLTQQQVIDRLEPLLGEQWSIATYSAAERSVAGKRVRQFSADELLAFAVAFDVPVSYFFLPPDAEGVGTGRPRALSCGTQRLGWRRVVDQVVIGAGTQWDRSLMPRIRRLPSAELPAAGDVSRARDALAGLALAVRFGARPSQRAQQLREVADGIDALETAAEEALAEDETTQRWIEHFRALEDRE